MALPVEFDIWIDEQGREWALWTSAEVIWEHTDDEVDDELGSEWRVATCKEILEVLDSIPLELPQVLWACEDHTIETHAMAIDVRNKRMYPSCTINMRKFLAIKR